MLFGCVAFGAVFGVLGLLTLAMTGPYLIVVSLVLSALVAGLTTALAWPKGQASSKKLFGLFDVHRHARAADNEAGDRSEFSGMKRLVSLLSEELHPDMPPKLLAIIRIANYDRMAAINVALADMFLDEFDARLQQALSKSRSLARIERNCFAIWFGGHGSVDEAKSELRALSYALTQQFSGPDTLVEPELKIASVVSSQPPETPAEMISRALASLVRFGAATPAAATDTGSFRQEERRRFTLQQDLARAIDNGELKLRYQPLVDTSQARIVGAEALLRWNHPQFGVVSPAEFVPLLEETGLMHDVGLWVLNTACRQLRDWRGAGWTDFRMAVNLSARQLENVDLGRIIIRTVQNHGLAPSSVELELTETAAMEDAARTLKLFTSLRDAGLNLSIDDFGSGYSSLSYLKNLPFNKLKIDREFVTEVDRNQSSQAICKALIELTSGLGITVLAEGVERREEVRALTAMGCTHFQGFYFAKPVDPFAFENLSTDEAWLSSMCSPVAGLHQHLKKRLSS